MSKCKQVKSNFPELYRDVRLGVSFEDGWFSLVNKLSQDIDKIAKDAGVSGEDYPSIDQIKEKFGGLRFYLKPLDKKIAKQVNQLVEKAEAESLYICEKCGQSGEQLKIGGWVKVLCVECAEKRRIDKGVK